MLAALLSTQGCEKAEERSILAKVNDDSIAAEEFKTRLWEYRMGAASSSLKPTPEEIALKNRILNEMIEEHVLLNEARKKGLDVTPDQVDDTVGKFLRDYPDGAFEERLRQQKISRARFKDRVRSNLIMEKLVAAVTKGVPQPTQETIEKYYKDRIETFQTREQYHLQQIVVKTEEDADLVLEELKKGELFEDLAKKHSFTADAAQGGDLGFVSPGMMPKEIEAELPKLVVNRPSQAISSDYGFHILKLTEKRPAHLATLMEAMPRIVQVLTQKDRELKFAAWRKELLSKARIERNHALLASIN